MFEPTFHSNLHSSLCKMNSARCSAKRCLFSMRWRGVGTQFPSCDYMHYSLKACLLDSLGMDGAKSNVEMANSAAGRTHSGFWKHPTLGLVEEEPNWLKERMDRIIGG
jgi:hypothetical protein